MTNIGDVYRRRASWGPVNFAIALAIATAAPLSQANALTLGAVAPPGLGGCTDCDVFQQHSEQGQPLYRVPPGNWLITSWSTQGGGSAKGQARLRVYRPTATQGEFRLVKQSALETIPPNQHPTFATSLMVQGGDLLGLGTVDNLVSAYSTAVGGPTVFTVLCQITGVGQHVGAGTGCKLGHLSTHQVNVKATLVKQ